MARKVSIAKSSVSAAVRLKQALALLISPTPGPHDMPRLTVAELCRLARISRNSLYRYHPAVLQALRDHQLRRPRTTQQRFRRAAARRRSELIVARDCMAKLAALVDHYYCACQEMMIRLDRQERDLAELRKRLGVKPALISDRAVSRR